MSNVTQVTPQFDVCLPLTLAYEGGWSNHPRDPGKATMRGVTQAVYDVYRRDSHLAARSVREIEPGEMSAIYRERYWQRATGDVLPVGVDYAVFDFAVNSGVARAVVVLQVLVGVVADGAMGPKTLAGVSRFTGTHGSAALSYAICDERMRFLKSLATYETFGRGWERRVMGAIGGAQEDDVGVADRALRMIRGETVTVPAAVATPKTYLGT